MKIKGNVIIIMLLNLIIINCTEGVNDNSPPVINDEFKAKSCIVIENMDYLNSSKNFTDEDGVIVAYDQIDKQITLNDQNGNKSYIYNVYIGSEINGLRDAVLQTATTDQIYIAAGNYNLKSTLIIDKNITLQGSGVLTNIIGSGLEPVITLNSSTGGIYFIKDLKVSNSESSNYITTSGNKGMICLKSITKGGAGSGYLISCGGSTCLYTGNNTYLLEYFDYSLNGKEGVTYFTGD